jgi:hypothetical protein
VSRRRGAGQRLVIVSGRLEYVSVFAYLFICRFVITRAQLSDEVECWIRTSRRRREN